MTDVDFMGLAVEAARAVAGRTGENPAVGCVIVRNGVVIGTGATEPPGGAHAEVMAIRAVENSGQALGGSDFFVTLEPFAFQCRTPPCSRLLAEKHPRRVVIGIRDPHPLVRGAGISELQAAGIEVVEGVLAEEIGRMLAGWVNRFADAG